MSCESYEFTRGDAFPFTLDQLTDLTGAAVTDVSSWSCRWTMRDPFTNAIVAQASTTAASGFTTISRGADFFTWIIPKATTATIAPNIYPADSEVSDPSGNPQTFHSVVKVIGDQSI